MNVAALMTPESQTLAFIASLTTAELYYLSEQPLPEVQQLQVAGTLMAVSGGAVSATQCQRILTAIPTATEPTVAAALQVCRQKVAGGEE